MYTPTIRRHTMTGIPGTKKVLKRVLCLNNIIYFQIISTNMI